MCTAVLSAAVQAATNGTTCGPSFNFFPAGKNTSLPTAWTQVAQQQAGNTKRDLLYTVALTSNRNIDGIDADPAVPELTVIPVHDLLVVGSSPSPACRGIGVKSTATSSITLQELIGSSTGDADLATGAQRRLLQGSVTEAAHFRVEYRFNGSSSWTSLGDFEKTLPAPRIVLNEVEGVADVSVPVGYYLRVA